jgi:drug/metabolite transporter (DMT)-like permease
MPPLPDARRGALLVAAAACCWSSGGLIARLVATDPWTTSFWRGLSSGLFLAAVLWLRARDGRPPRIGWPTVGFACSIALASTCFLLALARTSVANTLVVMSIGPYLAGLLGWLLLGERVPARSWLTMAVTVAGTAIMVSGSWAAGTIGGDLLAVAMAASFATGVVVVRANPDVSMAPAAALGALLAAALAWPFAAPLSASGRDLALLASFGVGQFAAGFLLFTAGAPRIPVAEASLLGLLEVVLGPLWVWLFLGERPGPWTLLGGGIVLVAVVTHAALDLARPATASPHRGAGPGEGAATRD